MHQLKYSVTITVINMGENMTKPTTCKLVFLLTAGLWVSYSELAGASGSGRDIDKAEMICILSDAIGRGITVAGVQDAGQHPLFKVEEIFLFSTAHRRYEKVKGDTVDGDFLSFELEYQQLPMAYGTFNVNKTTHKEPNFIVYENWQADTLRVKNAHVQFNSLNKSLTMAKVSSDGWSIMVTDRSSFDELPLVTFIYSLQCLDPLSEVNNFINNWLSRE